MKKTQQLDEIAFAPAATISKTTSGEAFDQLFVDLQGQVDIGTTPALAHNGAHGLIRTMSVKQGSESLVSIGPGLLRFLSQIDEAEGEALNPVSASSADQPFKATCALDFTRLFPAGTYIDATNDQPEAVVEFRFGAYTDGCDVWSAPTTPSRAGKLRPAIRTMARPPRGDSFRPSLVTTDLDASSKSSRQAFKFTADGPAGGVLMGFFIECLDASEVAAGLLDSSVDTLIRRVTMKTNSKRSKEDVATLTWGQLKRRSAMDLGIKRDASGLLPPGTAFVRMIDDQAPVGLRGGLALDQGETVELTFDTKSDVEEEFGAAAGLTPASGDTIRVTPVYAQRRRALESASTPAGSLAGSAVSGGRRRPRRPRRR